ncbi:MAG TPA: 4-alpha-glucanotransferase [Thermoanaerobaculia bacterium]
MRTSALRDLARQYSIETSYIDAAGKRVQAGKDALAAAVEVRAKQASRTAEPVRVAWRGKLDVDGDWDVALEDGSWRSGRGAVTLDLPLGYHMLYRNEAETLIIAAPYKAYAPRNKTWGLFTPLYAAHTRRSWGAGDLGDLLQYASWVDHHGGSVVATLPMLAAFDDEPSPYSPVSRLFWNELYLDVTRLPEFQPGDADLGAIAHLQQTKQVDHEGVRREKRRVLQRCVERFAPDVEFERFAGGEARDYARFRGDERYHLYVQYRLAQQMREVANTARRLGAGLYLDFPLGVHPLGYDAQHYAHVFAKGMSVGAPPDLVFTGGQNWGFAPFDPDAIRDDRYRYFRKAVRHHVAHAGILRIDHVMGLHRLYWIPEGGPAKDGVYVRYRADELYAILTLESQRHGCTVVGEDLGTVPPEVPKTMQRHGIRRMFVVQYEGKLNDPPAASVASVNTHDMPTFASWSRDQDVGSLESVLMFLARSDAEIVLINLEDLWGETEPQNVPGVPERSWRHKLRMSLEDAQADGTIRRVLTNVSEARGLLKMRGPKEQVKEG